jgi:HlyD family secretion protein/macrolide-specific efflux system membrane fusion protein
MKRRRWPWVLGAVLVLAGAGVFVSRRGAAAAPIDAALVVTVTRHPLAVDILETGRVHPRVKADVKSKVAGQVSQVMVQEGTHVKKGDVLLVLDPVDYQRELARAEADVAQARSSLDFATLSHERAEKGVALFVTARSELDQKTHDEQASAVSLRSSEVALAIARDHLRYTRIESPIDGTVIVRGIEPGEVVVPGVQSTFDGKALMTVADLSALVVKVNLNQIDVAKVAVGRDATLTLDALPGHTYHARVTKVAPASVKLAGKDQEVFPVEALLDTPDGLIKPGMTADVRVHLDAKDAVLAIPLEAVVKDAGKTYVMRVVDDPAHGKGAQRTEKVEVALGLQNEREVEITSGLDEGAHVLLKPPSASENETKL